MSRSRAPMAAGAAINPPLESCECAALFRASESQTVEQKFTGGEVVMDCTGDNAWVCGVRGSVAYIYSTRYIIQDYCFQRCKS